MIFNASVQSDNIIETYIISANTWNTCISYLEGTGKKINGVNQTDQQSIIVNNPLSNECYYIALKNNITNLIITYIIFDTYQNSLNWVTQQSGYVMNSFNRQNKTFISI